MTASDRTFQAQLVDYESARNEMLGAISNQHLALTFGTASIIGVIVAGFLTWGEEANPVIFFLVPWLSAWVLGMWVAEVVRMLRAVEFCADQARVINRSLAEHSGAGASTVPVEAIRWEDWRRAAPWRTITWTYISVVAVLSAAFLIGLACALVTAWQDWPHLVVVALGLAHLGVGAALLRQVWRLFKRWTEHTDVGMPNP